MNIDILQLIKLAFAIVEDTELKDNKTFQIAHEVVKAIDPPPQPIGSPSPLRDLLGQQRGKQ